MKKYKLLSLTLLPLTFVMYFVNSFTVASFNKICAADFSEDCIDNYGACPTGTTNFLQYAQDGNFSGSNKLTRTAFINSLKATFSGDSERNSCIVSGYTQFILRIMPGDEYNSVSGQNMTPIDEDFGGYKGIPRACPLGWHSDEGANTVFGSDNLAEKLGTFHLQGCCPAGFEFVNTNSDFDEFFQGGQALQAGVCCRSSKGPFTHWNHDRGCMNDDSVAVPNSAQVRSTHATLQAALTDMAQHADIIIAVDQNNGFQTSVSGNLDGLVKPQFGLGLNLSYPSAIVSQGSGTAGSSKVCPSGTACAITAAGNVESGNIVAAGSFATTPGQTCYKCYANNVSMATFPDPSDSTKKMIRFCDTSKPNLYRDEVQIGTEDITNGAIITDAANRPAYIACFNSGGVYTAIGCVDPTPTGIITGVIRIALGVMGGVALLQLIYVGILYQAGQEDKIKQARGQLMATLTGLAVLVFSILILRIIGVNVLDILPRGSV